MALVQPFRSPWYEEFPNAWIHAPESSVKKHAAYRAAKAGGVDAASDLVLATLNEDAIFALAEFGEIKEPVLVSVHTEEAVGVNAIPEVMADTLAKMLGWELEQFVVQANVVNHTGANGFARMARQAFLKEKLHRAVTT